MSAPEVPRGDEQEEDDHGANGPTDERPGKCGQCHPSSSFLRASRAGPCFSLSHCPLWRAQTRRRDVTDSALEISSRMASEVSQGGSCVPSAASSLGSAFFLAGALRVALFFAGAGFESSDPPPFFSVTGLPAPSPISAPPRMSSTSCAD